MRSGEGEGSSGGGTVRTRTEALDLVSVQHALCAADHLSFSRAARVLETPSSVISRRVRGLEDALGVSLFERHSGGVRPTEAGRRFFERMRRVLDDLDYAVMSADSAGRGAVGRLGIGIFASIGSGFAHELIDTFNAGHPRVFIDVMEGDPCEHVARIKERRLDVAFVTGEPVTPGCEAEQLWCERVFVALPARHPLSVLPSISWRQVRHERFLVSAEEPGPEIHDYIVSQVGELGHQPSVDRYKVGREALMSLVSLCLGVSVISEAGVATAYPGVVFRPLADGDRILPFSAVWAPANDNPALRRFLSTARALARGLPPPPQA